MVRDLTDKIIHPGGDQSDVVPKTRTYGDLGPSDYRTTGSSLSIIIPY